MEIPQNEEFRQLLERFASARWIEWSRFDTSKLDPNFDFRLTEHGEERLRLLGRMLLSELKGISDAELATLKKLLAWMSNNYGSGASGHGKSGPAD